MRQAAIYSAALHIVVISIAYFGVPALFESPPLEDQPISVELVSSADLVPPPESKPEPPPPQAKPAPPPPQAKPEPPPPPPPQVAERVPEPPPPPAAKPEPPPPPPEPKPEPKPVAKPAPKPKPKPKPPEVEKPPAKAAQPAPRPKRKPQREEQKFQALLKNLAKQKEAQDRTRKPPEEEKPAPAPPVVKQVARASIDRRASERRLTAMVKEQLVPCWSIPAGAKDAQNMRVGVQIRLNSDGTLRGVPRVLDTARMQSDRVFRAVAESAMRALRNPKCSPLKLPYDEYEIWQNITFNFDPGEALGR